MAKTLDMLLRRATINGAPTIDSRVVADADRRAVLIGKIAAEHVVLASWTDAEWTIAADGRIQITSAHPDTPIVEGLRDTRCGSCGGRYELKRVDAKPFLAELAPMIHVEPVTEAAE